MWQIFIVWKFLFQVIQYQLIIPDKVIFRLRRSIIRQTCNNLQQVFQMLLNRAKIAELCVYIILYSYCESKKTGNFKIQFPSHQTGWTFCLSYQLTHLFQVDEYVEQIPPILDKIIRYEALSDILSSTKRFLRQPKLLIVLFRFG